MNPERGRLGLQLRLRPLARALLLILILLVIVISGFRFMEKAGSNGDCSILNRPTVHNGVLLHKKAETPETVAEGGFLARTFHTSAPDQLARRSKSIKPLLT